LQEGSTYLAVGHLGEDADHDVALLVHCFGVALEGVKVERGRDRGAVHLPLVPVRRHEAVAKDAAKHERVLVGFLVVDRVAFAATRIQSPK